MSMITSFGPAAFDVTLGSTTLNHCIQLTATATSGEFTMAVARRAGTTCSGADFKDVATVTLDSNNNITSVTFTDRWGGHGWGSMSGSFGTTTGSGSINTNDDPRTTNGSWSAGGTGIPFPQTHGAGHGQHA
jgi:hypothetical protein